MGKWCTSIYVEESEKYVFSITSPPPDTHTSYM